MIKIPLKDLNELDTICFCLEQGLKLDAIHPDNRKEIKELAEKLRNIYEVGKDIERESAN